MPERTDCLNTVARRAAHECFNTPHCHDNNLEERKEDGLGITISQWAKWDGSRIMRVFASALEDANFHTEATIVQEWLDSKQ